MFTHHVLGTNMLDKAKQFYDSIMDTLGHKRIEIPGDQRLVYPGGEGTLIVGQPHNKEAATYANGGTVGFAAKSDAEVDAWHAAGLANGGTCEGAPGNRPNAPGNAYGAYLRDPDGNKLCCFNMPKH